jgi:hypothetical protein
MSRWKLVALAGCAAVALGCCSCAQEEERRAVYPVRGRILFQGRAAAGVRVAFHPRDSSGEELIPAGQTDEGGWFSLTTYAAADGAPAGRYTVTVQGPQPDGGSLPVRYARATTSGLHAVIQEGRNQLPPLQLKK